MTTTFNHIIGQDSAKARLNFYLDGYAKTRISPNLMFFSSKGMGKTEMARAFAKALKKPAFELNASTIKNVKQFMDFWFNYGFDKDITLLIDEAHLLVDEVFNILLTALNPNKDNKNTVHYNDVNVDFDFRKCTMMFATTEKNKVPIPLIDRLTEISLDEYTQVQIAEIITKNVTKVKITDEAALTLANFSRGNGRSAAKIGNEVDRFCSIYDVNIFETRYVGSIIKVLDLLPLGLTRGELNVLQLVSQREATTLTMLASKSGLTKPAQQEIESYLLKHNLIEITTGRRITQKGQNYLKNLV